MKANKIKCLAATFLLAAISCNQVKSFCQATTDTTSSTVMNEKKETNPNDGDLGSKLEELGYLAVFEGEKFEGKVSNGKNLWNKRRNAPKLTPVLRTYKRLATRIDEFGEVMPDYVEMVSNEKVTKLLRKLIGFWRGPIEWLTKEEFKYHWYNSAKFSAKKSIVDKYIGISRCVLQSKDRFLKAKLSPDFTEKLFSYSQVIDAKGTDLLLCEECHDNLLDYLISSSIVLGDNGYVDVERSRLRYFPNCGDFKDWGGLDWGGWSKEKFDTLQFKNRMNGFFESISESGIFSRIYEEDGCTTFYCDENEVIKVSYISCIGYYEKNVAHFYRLKDGRWLIRCSDPNQGFGIVSSSVTPEMIAAFNVHVLKNGIKLGTQMIPYLERGCFIKKGKIKDKSFYAQLNRKILNGKKLYRSLADIADYHKRDEEICSVWENILGADAQDCITPYKPIDSVKIDNFNDYALVDGFDYTRSSNGKPYTEYRLGLPYEELASLINKAKAMADVEEKARMKKEQEEADRRLREIKLGMLFEVFKQYYDYKVVRVSSSEIVVKRNNTYYYFEKGIFDLMLLAHIVNY